jgi:hypothetical protein
MDREKMQAMVRQFGNWHYIGKEFEEGRRI